MEKIINQFKKINALQEKMLQLCDEKTSYIDQQDMTKASAVIKQEMLTLHDLERSLGELKTHIGTACRAFGQSVEKLESLFPYATTEEKEQLMACQRYAISCEKILKNKLKNNERQVEVKMAFPEIIHKMRVQHLQENGATTALYNKKF